MTKVKLTTPIEFGDEVIAELTFRKGRFGDLRGMKIVELMDVPVDKIIEIASRMTEQPEPMIKLVDEADVGRVLEVVSRFLQRCLMTGSSPSAS